MLGKDNVTNYKMLTLIPDAFKGVKYQKPADGDVKTITKIAYNVYVAKTNGNVVVDKTGKPVLNTVAYVMFDDNTYSTYKGDTAISQLISETGVIDFESEGSYEFDANCKVRIISVQQAYGRDRKMYAVPAFEPM